MKTLTRATPARLRRIKEGLPGEVVYEGRMPNGLAVMVSPKPGFTKKFAIFSTRYGSVDNHFVDSLSGQAVRVPDGIAHFLEHELFAQETGDSFDEFAKNGASANASTSFTTTSYVFSCTDNFEKNLRLLLEFVGTPYFTEQNVEKERGIIGQEIKMYEDNADWRVFMNLMAALYHHHPIRIDIAGTVESIGKITKETLYQCYRTFYHPSNMGLFVAGDVDSREVVRLVQAVSAQRLAKPRGSGNGVPRASVDGSSPRRIQRFLPQEPQLPARREVSQSLTVSQPKVAIGFKDARPLPQGSALVRREIATQILLDTVLGKSSALYSALYEKGIIDDSFSASYAADHGYGFSVVAGETDEPARFVREIQSGLARVRREGLSDEDVTRIRRKAIGKFVKQFNSPESTASALLHYHFKGSSVVDYFRALRRVTRHDLQQRLEEHLTSRSSAVSLILPKKAASA